MIFLALLLAFQQDQTPEYKETVTTHFVPQCKPGYELWRVNEPLCQTEFAVPAVYHEPTAIDTKVDPKDFAPVPDRSYVCRKKGYVARQKTCGDHK